MDLTMKTIQKKLAETAGASIGRHRYFSVLVPFVEKDGEIHILYEVRAKDLAADPGEICFPGGHMEPGESPADCAVRETFEEVGIPMEDIRLFGQGKTLHGYANYTLYTYLGEISYEAYCQANPAKEEVDEIFLVPLRRFFETEPEVYSEVVKAQVPEDFPFEKIGISKAYKWRNGQWNIPVYDVDGRIIWGLTGRITADIIETLKASE